MKLTLGRRIGLLTGLLELSPSTFTLEACAEALMVLGDPALKQLNAPVLSKILGGSYTDRFARVSSETKVIDIIIKLLGEDKGIWERYETSPEEMRQSLRADPHVFVAYLSRLLNPPAASDDSAAASKGPAGMVGDLPTLPGIDKIHRAETQRLSDAVRGYCLLYRLGEESRSGISSNGNPTSELIPVLRRIPVNIEDNGNNYLLYKDSYSLYEEHPGDDRAAGYMFYTKQNFTILAEDYDDRGVSELFLVQLRRTRLSAPAINVYEGMMVMNGDVGVPTACRVLFKKAPDEAQQLPWDAFVTKYERKVDLKRAGDGTYQPVNDVDDAKIDGLTSNLLVKRLQIEAKVSLLGLPFGAG